MRYLVLIVGFILGAMVAISPAPAHANKGGTPNWGKSWHAVQRDAQTGIRTAPTYYVTCGRPIAGTSHCVKVYYR